MLDIFTQQPLQEGITHFDKLEILLKSYRRDLEKIQYYYNGREVSVQNNHLLVRILRKLKITPDSTLFSIMDFLDIQIPFIENYFNIGNSIRDGIILTDSVIPNTENYFLHRDYNVDYFTDDWTKWIPVKPIDYSGIGLEMNHPLYIKEPLLTIGYEIDLKLLGVMYWYWLKDRLKNNLDLNPNKFIYQYVLGNMIGVFLDLSIFNRLIDRNSFGEFKITHPFAITNKEDVLMRYLNTLYINLQKHTLHYYSTLKSIPLVFNKNAYELFKIDNINYSKRAKTYEFMLRSKIMLFLINLYKKKGLRLNSTTLFNLKILLKYMGREDILIDKLTLENLNNYQILKEKIKGL